MSGIERQRGLTLVELILFIVVIGLALAAVLAAFNTAARSSGDPVIRKQAIAIAESLLEEMRAVPYACPAGATCDPVTTGNRTDVHALTDYHGFTMNGIRALDGTSIPQLSGYSATVAVTDEALSGRAGKRIRITVTHDASGEGVTLEGWRGEY